MKKPQAAITILLFTRSFRGRIAKTTRIMPILTGITPHKSLTFKLPAGIAMTRHIKPAPDKAPSKILLCVAVHLRIFPVMDNRYRFITNWMKKTLSIYNL